jgi:hypothetical protein
MNPEQAVSYLEPTRDAGRTFLMRQLKGKIVMLNLLRFRAIADYSATPELAPNTAISGAEAFRLYIKHTLPYLRETGGDLFFIGAGGPFLIGRKPSTGIWPCWYGKPASSHSWHSPPIRPTWQEWDTGPQLSKTRACCLCRKTRVGTNLSNTRVQAPRAQLRGAVDVCPFNGTFNVMASMYFYRVALHA